MPGLARARIGTTFLNRAEDSHIRKTEQINPTPFTEHFYPSSSLLIKIAPTSHSSLVKITPFSLRFVNSEWIR
jgi:hypothetical protein